MSIFLPLQLCPYLQRLTLKRAPRPQVSEHETHFPHLAQSGFLATVIRFTGLGFRCSLLRSVAESCGILIVYGPHPHQVVHYRCVCKDEFEWKHAYIYIYFVPQTHHNYISFRAFYQLFAKAIGKLHKLNTFFLMLACWLLQYAAGFQ